MVAAEPFDAKSTNISVVSVGCANALEYPCSASSSDLLQIHRGERVKVYWSNDRYFYDETV